MTNVGSLMNDLPKYAQIKQVLKRQIHSGVLDVGAHVPSERELTVAFGVTRNQTRQALRELELEGYLERSQGRRSVVAPVEKRARPLVMANKPTFAIAMQDQQTLHTQRILQGFMQDASKAGVQTIAYNLEFDRDGELKFLEHIRDSGMAGLAFWPHYNQDAARELLASYVQNAFPVVLLDRYLPGLDVDAVVTDNVAVGRLLTEALIRLGHRRIAFLAEEDHSTSAGERFDGFAEAHAAANIPLEESMYAVIERGYGDAETAVRALQSRKDRPTAYFCVHDRLAQTAAAHLARLGYQMPDDIQFASLGDEECARLDGPPMLALMQPSVEMGRKAFDVLWRRCLGEQAERRTYRMSPVPERPVAVQPARELAVAAHKQQAPGQPNKE